MAHDEPTLIIDYGTSTSAAMLVVGSELVSLREPAGGDSRPSAVCLYQGQVLTGNAAENAGLEMPDSFREGLKRMLGGSAPVLLGEREYDVVDLVAQVLRTFREQAAALHGGTVDRAVLTVPASYGRADLDPRAQAMIHAGERAGFVEVELLPEPVAAAHAPINGAPLSVGSIALVCDYGGGTFDAAVVELGKSGAHQVRGHAALDDCGGDDLDVALARHLRDLGGDDIAALLDGTSDSADRDHVRLEFGELVRRTKHQLAEVEESRPYFRSGRRRFEVARSKLVELGRPDIDRTIGCCLDLLRRSDLPLNDLGAVILTGGGSYLPGLSTLLSGAFGRPIRSTTEPVLAVVHGAAHWLLHRGNRSVAPRPPAPGTRHLVWELDGGAATVLRWHVAPGAMFEPSAPLLAVRTAAGSLLDLCADDRPGVVTSYAAGPGEPVSAVVPAATVSSLPPLARMDAEVDRVEFSPDGTLLAVTAGRYAMWDVHRRREIGELAGHGRVAFPVDQATMVVGWDEKLTVRRLDDNSTVNSVKVADRAIRSPVGRVACARNSATVLVQIFSQHVGVWDGRSDHLSDVWFFAGDDEILGLDVSPDGRTGAICLGSTVRGFNVGNGQTTFEFDARYPSIGVRFSPDGRFVAAGSLWHLGSVWNVAESKEVVGFPHDNLVWDVAYREDSQVIATASWDTTARLWRPSDGWGQEPHVLHHDSPVSTVAISPDGRLVATGCKDGTVHLHPLPQAWHAP